MFTPKSAIAAGLIALTVTGTTLAAPTEADAHPLLLIGLAAGAVGALVGTAIAHPSHVVIEGGRGPNCVVKERTGWWGRVHAVEVCR